MGDVEVAAGWGGRWRMVVVAADVGVGGEGEEDGVGHGGGGGRRTAVVGDEGWGSGGRDWLLGE